MSATTKLQQRQELKTALDRLTEEEFTLSTQQLNYALKSWLILNPSYQHIGVYSAYGREVDLSSTIKDLAYLKWCFPLVNDQHMTFHYVKKTHTLVSGYRGIPEPSATLHPLIPAEQLDLVLCPGLGFSPQGERLGKGGGFYDRYLSQIPSTIRMGICFPDQQLSSIVSEPHDVKMTHLLTTNGVIEL